MLRLADISGPFYDPSKPFRNWSSFPFAQIDQAAPPYVDQRQLGWGVERACLHLETLHTQGYTGIVIDNLAHLITFDAASPQIYAAASPFRLRALAYRAAFSRLFDAATRLGMDVYVTSDMQWSTPPLRRAVGEMRVGNSYLLELNRLALAELFETMPQVAGLVVRVGEAGGAHNQGNDYSGHMLYTSPARLRALIESLLPTCEAHDRTLIVRTWSVGIGDLGDLICSPERYYETFGRLRSANLLVSVKHGPADFFRLMPPNPTLGLPGPRQIVELQNRREYELFGMVPSSVATLHRAALARAIADPQCVGFWAWNATGGWGGGQAVLGEQGWSLWTELSSALTTAISQNTRLDENQFVRSWLHERLPAPVSPPSWPDALADLYLESAELIEGGWYMGWLPGSALVGGIYLSPLLWVWWMRPTAALPIWAYLAETVDDIDVVLSTGAQAMARAMAHAERLALLAPADDLQAAQLVDSARYLASALEVAYTARALMLPLMRAAYCGERPSVAELRLVAQQAILRIVEHRRAWAGRTDLPPLEVAELEQFAHRLEHAPRLIWTQIRITCAVVRWLRSTRPKSWGTSISLGRAGALIMAAALPWISRRLNLLPSIFFETGPSIGEWAL